MFLLIAALVTVSGTVVNDATPLPGVTVTLTGGTLSRTAVSNEHGQFAFPGVSEGTYDLRATLDGFGPTEHLVTVRQEDVVVPPQELKIALETITISCGLTPCTDIAPQTPYEQPLCSDYAAHSDWIEAAEKGDRSASALLRIRYAQELSGIERHRIGAALMREDAGIFGELIAATEVCTKFPKSADRELSAAYLEWAAARELPAEDHWWLSFNALTAAALDPRSRPLLLRLLDADDPDLVHTAVGGLASQRDVSSLPAIGRAFERFPGRAESMAYYLSLMLSPEADELAMRYLDEDSRDQYRKDRELAATLTR